MAGIDDRGCAIVTGAVGNIGSDVTRRLARDGFALFMIDQAQDKLDAMVAELQATGARAMGVVADVRARAAIEAAVQSATQAFGPVHALVNVVGHSGSRRINEIEDIDDDLWDELLVLNLRSAFNCCRAVIPGMKARRYGRIVNFATSGAFGTRSPVSGCRLPYISAKAGVIGLTGQLAKDLALHGVTANVVSPGLVLGKPGTRVRQMWEGNMTPQQIADVMKQYAMNRPAEPEEVASAVSFLVSPDSSYVSGQVLRVDGATH